MVGSTSSSALLIALLTGCQLHDFGQLLANTHRLHWSMVTRPSDREIASRDKAKCLRFQFCLPCKKRTCRPIDLIRYLVISRSLGRVTIDQCSRCVFARSW